MSALAAKPSPALVSSADSMVGPLRSAADFASDGTARLAPIGAVWNSPELCEAYNDLARRARQQSLQGGAADHLVDTIETAKRLWAADYAFRPIDAGEAAP